METFTQQLFNDNLVPHTVLVFKYVNQTNKFLPSWSLGLTGRDKQICAQVDITKGNMYQVEF